MRLLEVDPSRLFIFGSVPFYQLLGIRAFNTPFCVPNNLQKRIAQLRAFFEIVRNRLFNHPIWSPDEVPIGNRNFGAKLIK